MSQSVNTPPWRRTSSRPIYESPWLKVSEDSVVRPDGTPGIYGVIEIPEYSGIVAIDDRGRIALVRQWRYLYREPSLEVPAGSSASTHESPLATAQRELLEETGLVASEWIPLGRVRYSAVTNMGHLFLARTLRHASPAHVALARDDWTELVWMDYHEAITCVLEGMIVESTSLAALGKAEIARHRGIWAP